MTDLQEIVDDSVEEFEEPIYTNITWRNKK